MGSWTLGADNATVRNVPEPGSEAIQPRRPIPRLGPVRSIRFDGKSIYHGVTFKAKQRLRNNYADNVSYSLSTSKDDASSPGATEAETNVPQNVRNIFDETGEWAYSSFDHRHVFVASGTYVLPFFAGAGGLQEGLLGGWWVNAVFFAQAGAPFTINLGVDRANIGAGPAQRPDQLSDPQPASGRSRAAALVRHRGVCAAGAFHFRDCSAEQRRRSRLRQPGSGRGEDMDDGRKRPAGVSVGSLQRSEQSDLRSAEPDLRDTELRPDLQREESARDAVCPEAELLTLRSPLRGRGPRSRIQPRAPLRAQRYPPRVTRRFRRARR